MSNYEVTIGLPEEVQIELGKTLVLFNLIEASLDNLLTVFIHAEGRAFDIRVAHIMSAELSFKQKIGQVDSILRLASGLAEQSKDDPHIANCQTALPVVLEHWIEIKKHLCLAEEKRNAFIHSNWSSAGGGGQIEILVLEDGGHGWIKMIFGGASASTEASHIAVRSKVTAKQGKGLVYKTEALSLEQIKGVSIQFALTLNLISLFQAYFYRDVRDGHEDLVGQMISQTPLGEPANTRPG